MSGAALQPVADDEAEIRLDRWFRRHFPDLTQGAIQKPLPHRAGAGGWRARERGHAARCPARRCGCRPRPRRQPADHVSRDMSTAPRPPVDPRDAEALLRRVFYRDDALIVLDKPFGLPVQGGPGITRHLDALLDALRFDADERPRLVHRLDRDTSGVLAAGAHAWDCGAARGRVPRARPAQDLLGGGRRPPASGRGPDRPAARPHQRPARRADRARLPAARGRSRTTPRWIMPAAASPGWSCRR